MVFGMLNEAFTVNSRQIMLSHEAVFDLKNNVSCRIPIAGCWILKPLAV
jgi:hypothetical protein